MDLMDLQMILKRGCTREWTMRGPRVTWGSPFWLKFSPVVRNELKNIGANFFWKIFPKFPRFWAKTAQNGKKVIFFTWIFRALKTAVEISSRNIYGGKMSEFLEFFGILRKYWEEGAIRRFFIFQFFQVFIFLSGNCPPIFLGVQIGPIAHKISKIHPTVSP